MDPVTHTLLATGCMLGAFYIGKMITVKSVSSNLIASMLDKLELDGFIITETDKDGEKINEWVEGKKKERPLFGW